MIRRSFIEVLLMRIFGFIRPTMSRSNFQTNAFEGLGKRISVGIGPSVEENQPLCAESRLWGQPYSLVTCGDVLYDAKLHPSLLELLRRLQFERLLIGYKKRHADKEKAFFKELSEFCEIRVVVGGVEEQIIADEGSNLSLLGGKKAAAEVAHGTALCVLRRTGLHAVVGVGGCVVVAPGALLAPRRR